MKKIQWILVLILTLGFSLGCCSTAVKQAQYPAIQNSSHFRNAVVALVSDDHIYCSGVWVDEEHFLTAFHCVSDESNKVTFGAPVYYSTHKYIKLEVPPVPPSREFLGVVVAGNKATDLALVRSVHDVPHHIAECAPDEQLIPGMQVHIIGHTIGLEYTHMTGVISATRHVDLRPFMPHNSKMLHITALIGPGNSGGGVFDEHGHLIGITSFIHKRVPGISFFAHRDEIVNFLEAAL